MPNFNTFTYYHLDPNRAYIYYHTSLYNSEHASHTSIIIAQINMHGSVNTCEHNNGDIEQWVLRS